MDKIRRAQMRREINANLGDYEVDIDELRHLLDRDEALERCEKLPERWRAEWEDSEGKLRWHVLECNECADELDRAIKGE